MKKIFFLILIIFNQNLYSQLEDNFYELNTLDTNFLTYEVKNIIDQNIEGKQTVFLGEAVHHSGSDFLAKTEFVKYLVTEQGFKDIAFESDFIGLLFDHKIRSLNHTWKECEQCEELIKVLEDNDVTIWGFDIQFGRHTHYFFPKAIKEFSITNGIEIDEKFLSLTDKLMRNRLKPRKVLSKSDINFLNDYITTLSQNEKVKSDKQWTQILESYKSAIKLYYTDRYMSVPRRNPTRDTQMAKNLDFIVKQNPDKKFIVWLANAHMSKCNYEYMKGLTMGYQFRELNPNTSYHIAFGSMRIQNLSEKRRKPIRKEYNAEAIEKTLIKASKNRDNIVYYLPSVHKNYFLDAKSVSAEFRDKGYYDLDIFNIYWVYRRDTKLSERDLLNHFDAFVFTADWVEASYKK